MIETFDVEYLKERENIIRSILKYCPKEIFHDNYHMFRLFEYIKCFDVIRNNFAVEEQFTYVDVGSCRSYLPYYVALNYPYATVYMTDLEKIPNYFLWGEPKWHSNLRFEKANCHTLSKTFGENSVDIISCISVIEHTDDEKLSYEQMMKTLKAGGHLCMTTDIDFTDPSEQHPRKYNTEMFAKRNKEFFSYIPDKLDISSAEEQLAKVENNKKIYETFPEDIKKDVEMYSMHYLAGFYEIVKES